MTLPKPVVRTHLLATAACLVLLAGCSTTQSPATQLHDTGIKTDVLARLAAEPDLAGLDISVEVNEGVVYLSGKTENRQDIAQAARVAGRADGVRRVVNYLGVGEESAGERVDDGSITARVKTKLATEMNPFNVNITTTDGVVYLTGRVATAQDKVRAEQLARSVDGVRGVRNDLQVGDVGG